MHTRFIGISFTIKDQPIESIAPVLEKIEAALSQGKKKPILVNGFMPKHVVLEKGFSPVLVNTLEELFPLQINCYRKNAPDRQVMADLLQERDGVVYVVGKIVEGVAEEVAMYTGAGVRVIYVPLEFDGELSDLL